MIKMLQILYLANLRRFKATKKLIDSKSMWHSAGEVKSIPTKIICVLMVVERAIAPESPKGVQFFLGLMAAKYSAYDSHHFHAQQAIHVLCGGICIYVYLLVCFSSVGYSSICVNGTTLVIRYLIFKWVACGQLDWGFSIIFFLGAGTKCSTENHLSLLSHTYITKWRK